jgi:dTDP-4-dehydrorhamnose reductase
MKIIILGAKGMFGHDLADVFKKENPILWDKDDLDITKENEVRDKIADIRPTLIINAAAYTDVDGAQTNSDLAMKINGNAVGYLAETAKNLGAILVHYSTDYVFDGKKKDGYVESDKPNPLNIYGQSKFLGEKLLLEKGEMYYLIRSSWLYGKNGKNFVDTIIAKAKKEKFFTVVDDQYGRPTYAKDLAQATKELVDQMKPCGIYHLVNETPIGGISWFNFAEKIISLTGLETEVKPCKTKDFPRPAKRPMYGSLINTKSNQLRDWENALADYLAR